MTIPWQMNCNHEDEGWCLSCVSEFGGEYMNLQVRNMDLNAENAKLREQLAECDVKLEEAIDMLVNLYDLGNLDDEWMGKVAMVLAKNDK